MTSRVTEIGQFDVAEADTIEYDSQKISTEEFGVGDIRTNVAQIDLEEASTVAGIKVFYELYAPVDSPDGRRKIIWQVSTLPNYWYPNDGHTSTGNEQMPPGIYDQTKQSIPGKPGERSLSEIEKFVNPDVYGTAPSTVDSAESIAIHARASNDSDIISLDARVTLTVWLQTE